MLDIILIILGVLCLITGLMGCILPFLPGPPLLIWDWSLHFMDKDQHTTTQLIVWLLIVLVVQVLDYFTPMLGSKYSGGSRWGQLGMYHRDPYRPSFPALGSDFRSVLGSSYWNC